MCLLLLRFFLLQNKGNNFYFNKRFEAESIINYFDSIKNYNSFSPTLMNKGFKNQLKNTFTSYWHYLALQTACKLNIFDEIEGGVNAIVALNSKLNLNFRSFSALIDFLIKEQYLNIENETLLVTEKGSFLTENHSDSLKNACVLWGEEHLTAWQNLDYTIKTGKPAFEKIFDMPFFDYLNTDNYKLNNYHKAMAEYARDDYQNIIDVIDFSAFNTIADVGGGTGNLLQYIAKKYPQKNCILFDLPEVINLVDFKVTNIQVVSGSFFNTLPFTTDAIILSRILHDWNNNMATKILKNCLNVLKPNGKLFIIEIMQEEIKANLLSLNMMLMTESYERTYNQYNELLKEIDFKIKSSMKLNELQTILIAEKL